MPYHDGYTGETVAELWHRIAQVISLVAMASGIGIAITAGVGAAWHKWAAAEHRKELDRLERETNEQDWKKSLVVNI